MPSSEFSSFDNEIDLVYSLCALACVTCGALAAGMTVGLLSLDTLKLQIKLEVGTPEEKESAKKILPVLSNHHLLLCTLLLFNAAANESLPIFLDAIVPAWAAVVLSVTLVLLCGEIIPSALFTGPNQLYIAGKFTTLVYILEFLFYPIAYPMSKVLDKLLGSGEDDDDFGREEISALVKIILRNRISAKLKRANSSIIHFNENHKHENKINNKFVNKDLLLISNVDSKLIACDDNNPLHLKLNRSLSHSLSENGFSNSIDYSTHYSTQNNSTDLTHNEVNVITGVLSLSKILIRNVCIPMSKVNMLSSDQVLDKATIALIDKVGHSRLPVFKTSDSSNIMGYLLVKRLITINPEENIPLLQATALIEPAVVGASMSLLDVLNILQRGHVHMALVSEDPVMLLKAIRSQVPPSPSCAPIGVVTVEDVFEAMLQTQINDEEDGDGDDCYRVQEKESASVALRTLSSSFMSSSSTSEAAKAVPKEFGNGIFNLVIDSSSSSSDCLYSPILPGDKFQELAGGVSDNSKSDGMPTSAGFNYTSTACPSSSSKGSLTVAKLSTMNKTKNKTSSASK